MPPPPLEVLLPNGQVLAAQIYIDDPILGPIPWDGTTIGPITAVVTNDGTFATPARQDTGNTSLASIKIDVDTLVASGAGGYVRQDSTGTIAKETGGNLASVKTNTDKIPALGQALAASSAPVVLTAIQLAALIGTPGFAIAPYDYVVQTQASNTDTWVFKTGGSGGTTLNTITITYTDSTKVTISTVVKT